MFWKREWTLEWQTEHCLDRFGAKPLRDGRWLAHTMGLDQLFARQAGGYSRVIFSNGLQVCVYRDDGIVHGNTYKERNRERQRDRGRERYTRTRIHTHSLSYYTHMPIHLLE